VVSEALAPRRIETPTFEDVLTAIDGLVTRLSPPISSSLLASGCRRLRWAVSHAAPTSMSGAAARAASRLGAATSGRLAQMRALKRPWGFARGDFAELRALKRRPRGRVGTPRMTHYRHTWHTLKRAER